MDDQIALSFRCVATLIAFEWTILLRKAEFKSKRFKNQPWQDLEWNERCEACYRMGDQMHFKLRFVWKRLVTVATLVVSGVLRWRTRPVIGGEVIGGEVIFVSSINSPSCHRFAIQKFWTNFFFLCTQNLHTAFDISIRMATKMFQRAGYRPLSFQIHQLNRIAARCCGNIVAVTFTFSNPQLGWQCLAPYYGVERLSLSSNDGILIAEPKRDRISLIGICFCKHCLERVFKLIFKLFEIISNRPLSLCLVWWCFRIWVLKKFAIFHFPMALNMHWKCIQCAYRAVILKFLVHRISKDPLPESLWPSNTAAVGIQAVTA